MANGIDTASPRNPDKPVIHGRGRQVTATATAHRMRVRRMRATVYRGVLVFAGCALLSGCGLFGIGKDDKSTQISTFKIKVGECFNPPDPPKAELSELTSVPCTEPHTEESYAIVKYTPTGVAGATVSTAFPGADVLTNFANSECAQRYGDYMGVPYTDSTLFFAFLLPSARSWESGNDRDVICFVTTTGEKLTKSVKGSKR
jgi:hypothetical protein